MVLDGLPFSVEGIVGRTRNLGRSRALEPSLAGRADSRRAQLANPTLRRADECSLRQHDDGDDEAVAEWTKMRIMDLLVRVAIGSADHTTRMRARAGPHVTTYDALPTHAMPGRVWRKCPWTKVSYMPVPYLEYSGLFRQAR